VVTGGRRGIGRAIALALRDAGYDVIAISKSTDRGDLPREIAYMSCDLTFDIPKVVCDVLVNCAGMVKLSPINGFSEEDRIDMWEVNYHAPVRLSQTAVENGCKRVVNITSVSAFNGARNNSEYCATKAALTAWTKCASNEWAPMGVTVNCVAPGFIETDMLQFRDEQHEKDIIGRIPAGRLGKPEDVTGAVLFLLSDAARYITGTTIVVDGGWTAR
jgi:2-dehydro-3-deoxy-D-gluconate 5-dehydrogenase